MCLARLREESAHLRGWKEGRMRGQQIGALGSRGGPMAGARISVSLPQRTGEPKENAADFLIL